MFSLLTRLLLYLALALVGLWLQSQFPARLNIEISRGGSDASLPQSQRVRDAILLDQAYRLGWIESDPVIAGHLINMMRKGNPALYKSDALQKAFALGLHRHDPVIRARLLDRAQRALSTLPADLEITRKQLQRYYEGNVDNYAQPETRYVGQSFFVAQTSAEHARDHWIDAEIETMHQVGRPLAGLEQPVWISEEKLQQRLGKQIAEAAFSCPILTICGPIKSPFGYHLLVIGHIVASHAPQFEELEESIAADYRAWQKGQQFERNYSRLRQRYVVSWSDT